MQVNITPYLLTIDRLSLTWKVRIKWQNWCRGVSVKNSSQPGTYQATPQVEPDTWPGWLEFLTDTPRPVLFLSSVYLRMIFNGYAQDTFLVQNWFFLQHLPEQVCLQKVHSKRGSDLVFCCHSTNWCTFCDVKFSPCSLGKFNKSQDWLVKVMFGLFFKRT